MASPSDDPSEKPSLWNSRPIACAVALFVVAVFAVDRVGDFFGLNDVQKGITMCYASSFAFFVFGALNRTVHAGYSVLMGLIALSTAVVFTAMYSTNPDLFPYVSP